MTTLSDAEQLAEYAACAADPGYLCDRYGVIDDAQDDGGEVTGTTPFRLWPAQAKVLWQIVGCRQTIILKARQLGISWLVCLYVLWLCLFRPGATVLLFSKGQNEANELIRRIKALYDRLPEWLRERLPAMVGESTRELEWANESRVRSMPATKSSGVSYTATLIVLDECAHMAWADQLYTNAKPTIDGGGQLIILSTANGAAGLFYTLWTRAVEGLNSFRTIFLPWWARPDRDQAWYERIVRDSDDPKTVPQNYPANPLEAFLASGRTRFEPTWVSAQAGNVREPLPLDQLPAAIKALPWCRVYAAPVHNRRYVVAADVAEGLEHGDFDAAVVLDSTTWEEVACLHGHWEQDEFADYLICVAKWYRAAPIYVERNNHGHAVLTALKLKHYLRIGLGHDERPGWLTNEKTKPEAIGLVAAALRDGLVVLRTMALLTELQRYQTLAGGKTGAPTGQHDDRVMALAIALIALRLERLRAGSAPAVGGAAREKPKPRQLPQGRHGAS